MHGQMWIDGIFMGQMFLTRYGKSIGDTQYCWDEATKQMTVYAKRGQRDNSGLYLHGIYEPGHGDRECRWADPKTGLSPEVWSEGLGWYALVLVETLADLPKNHRQTGRDGGHLPPPGRRPQTHPGRRRAAAGSRSWTKATGPTTGPTPPAAPCSPTRSRRASKSVCSTRAEYAPVVAKGYKGIIENAKINDKGLVDIYSACDGVGVQTSYDRYINYKKSINAKEAVAGFLWATAIVEKPELEKLRK